jgi:hypothetical protein
MGKDYTAVIRPVAFFCTKLGHRAKNDTQFYTGENDFLIAAIREDIRKVRVFHPMIDPLLLRAELSLEEVIRYGMQSHEIEFFKGVKGVTAERCYQEGEALSKERILQIRDGVYVVYESFFDDKALEHTKRTYDPLRGEAERIVEGASSIIS